MKNVKKTSLIFALAFSILVTIPSFAASADVHSGTVKETEDAGGYTYLLVVNGGQEQWVAIPRTPVKVGDKVNYIHGLVMENFGSKILNRTFETIVFSEGLVKDAPKTDSSDMFNQALEQEGKQPEQHMDSSPGSSGAVTPFKEIQVEKATAENSYTIEELFSQREKLQDKTITVRGKVMKINLQIMGRNWVHLQDGSGDPMNNTHDLVLTTTDEPTEGDTTTFQGKVVIDQDFGFSYKYDLLIEEAKIVQ